MRLDPRSIRHLETGSVNATLEVALPTNPALPSHTLSVCSGPARADGLHAWQPCRAFLEISRHRDVERVALESTLEKCDIGLEDKTMHSPSAPALRSKSEGSADSERRYESMSAPPNNAY